MRLLVGTKRLPWSWQEVALARQCCCVGAEKAQELPFRVEIPVMGRGCLLLCGYEKSKTIWRRKLPIPPPYPGSVLLTEPRGCLSFTCGLEGLAWSCFKSPHSSCVLRDKNQISLGGALGKAGCARAGLQRGEHHVIAFSSLSFIGSSCFRLHQKRSNIYISKRNYSRHY